MAEGIGIIGAGIAGRIRNTVVDPVIGQGANTASYEAWERGTPITEDPVADEFTNNFNYPEPQWDILATPERTDAFRARHGMG
jgi:hypothetical protein